MALQTLTVIDTNHANIASIPVLNFGAWLGILSAIHKQPGVVLELTTGPVGKPGGWHNNTAPIDYGGINYLRCKHQHGNLQGVYKSPILDAGSSDRYLVYIVGQDTDEPDIVVVGIGTDWDSQVPDPATWESIGVATNSWTNIFALDAGPSVTMRLYYGETSPPTSYVDKMEILSAIVTARYFQVQININDPVGEVYAYVEEFSLRFCQ